MTDWVRCRLPWWWGWAPERLGAPDEIGNDSVDGAEGDMARLAPESCGGARAELHVWVSWFVDRYHLADEVPPCEPRHAALVDELSALWHYHQESRVLSWRWSSPTPWVTRRTDDPKVPARAYWEWHEASGGGPRGRCAPPPATTSPHRVTATSRSPTAQAARRLHEAASIELQRMLDPETEVAIPQ